MKPSPVSNNGPQLKSKKFVNEQFLKKNGIKDVISAPYHPDTNDIAERYILYVESFKNGMKSETVQK